MDKKCLKKKYVLLMIIIIVFFFWCINKFSFIKTDTTVSTEPSQDKKPEIVLYNEYIDMVNNWEESSDILTMEDLKEMVGIKYPIDSTNSNEKITVAVLDTGIFEQDRKSVV